MTFDADTATFVLFRLGEEGYGLPVDVVTSVVRFQEPTPVPRATHAVMGVVNLRGRVLPVVDLRARFGPAAFSAGPKARIVVAEGSSGPVGVAVDAVTEVATFTAEQIQAVPEGALGTDVADAFSGMVERADGLVILLDPDHALYANSPGDTAGGAAPAKKEEVSHV